MVTDSDKRNSSPAANPDISRSAFRMMHACDNFSFHRKERIEHKDQALSDYSRTKTNMFVSML
jgi:hypothetical protein